jgi:hypothetical protein
MSAEERHELVQACVDAPIALEDAEAILEMMDGEGEGSCFWALLKLGWDLGVVTVNIGLAGLACGAQPFAAPACIYAIVKLIDNIFDAVASFNTVVRECSSDPDPEEVDAVCLAPGLEDLMNNPDIDPAELQLLQSALAALCG